MPPKRSTKAAAASKSKKAKADTAAAENAAAPEVKEIQEPVISEDGEKAMEKKEKKEEVEIKESEETAAKTLEDKKVEEVKPAKGRGGKKKETVAPVSRRVTRANPGPKNEEAMVENTKDEEHTNQEGKAQVIIEYSKECNSFKKKAEELQSSLEKAIPAVDVCFNPEKPRKGCFEIRDQNGHIFFSLLGQTRPFKDLKDINVEVTVKTIVDGFKSSNPASN